MKKLLLATGLVLAQFAGVNAFAQGDMGGPKKAPTPSAQANGEKGTAPAGTKAGVDSAGSPGMPAKSGAAPAAGMAPTPTTEANGEKARAPAARTGSDMSGAASKGTSTMPRKGAPTPSTEANGEKADKKGGVGEMKSTAPAK